MHELQAAPVAIGFAERFLETKRTGSFHEQRCVRRIESAQDEGRVLVGHVDEMGHIVDEDATVDVGEHHVEESAHDPTARWHRPQVPQ